MNRPNSPEATSVSRNFLSKNSRRLTLVFVLVALTVAMFAITSHADRGITAIPAKPVLSQPVLVTDRSAYEAGDTIKFVGTNWEPGETVAIVVDSDQASNVTTLQAVADATGAFTIASSMPGQASGVENSATPSNLSSTLGS